MNVLDQVFSRRPHSPVPRGMALTGPPILSYGFRPFFLAAGLWAVAAMALWIGALSTGLEVGQSYGAVNWHAHEMLFGYASAAIAGFMLTAIPNWTGRLPVSGTPLLALVLIWCAGRLAMLAPDFVGATASAAIDALFLPALAFVAGREIFAGRNWKNLKILGALAALTVSNVGFHAAVINGLDTGYAYRFAVAALVMLIAIVGGRIVPSFTRNWLSRQSKRLPAAFGRIDQAGLAATALALLCWTVVPVTPLTAGLCLGAAILQTVRLWRWRGWSTGKEPMVAVLHLAYAFIPLGLVAIAASALGWLSGPSSLHVLTVGAIGNMTLAVMTRATLGHTGRAIAASTSTRAAYALLFAAAALRPFAELSSELYLPILSLAAAAWLLSFGLFLLEFGPMLCRARIRA